MGVVDVYNLTALLHFKSRMKWRQEGECSSAVRLAAEAVCESSPYKGERNHEQLEIISEDTLAEFIVDR
jgi:hypothetical protein